MNQFFKRFAVILVCFLFTLPQVSAAIATGDIVTTNEGYDFIMYKLNKANKHYSRMTGEEQLTINSGDTNSAVHAFCAGTAPILGLNRPFTASDYQGCAIKMTELHLSKAGADVSSDSYVAKEDAAEPIYLYVNIANAGEYKAFLEHITSETAIAPGGYLELWALSDEEREEARNAAQNFPEYKPVNTAAVDSVVETAAETEPVAAEKEQPMNTAASSGFVLEGVTLSMNSEQVEAALVAHGYTKIPITMYKRYEKPGKGGTKDVVKIMTSGVTQVIESPQLSWTKMKITNDECFGLVKNSLGEAASCTDETRSADRGPASSPAKTANMHYKETCIWNSGGAVISATSSKPYSARQKDNWECVIKIER